MLQALAKVKTPRLQTYQTVGKLALYEPPPEIADFIKRMALI